LFGHTPAKVKISVVTPSLNQARFISQSISSVIEQQGDFDVELFVMDGGSSDGTVEILKEYERKIGRLETSRISLSWKSEKDMGQAQAINQGLRLSRGQVLAFLNSDDTYAPGALQRVADFFRRNPGLLWLTGKCRIINAQGREIRKGVTAYKNFWLRHYCYPLLLAENFLSQPATFWRRGLYEEFGELEENCHYSLDYEYWLRLGEKYRPGFIDEYLANFRVHPESKGGRGEKLRWGDGLDLIRRYGRPYGYILPLYLFNYVKMASAFRLLRWLGR